MENIGAPICLCLLPTVLITLTLSALAYYNFYRAKKRIAERTNAILAYADEWGLDNCHHIINRKIGIGMTPKMVIVAWGKPSTVDQLEQTTTYTQERWVYGQPRQGIGANYVIIRNQQVHKITQNFAFAVEKPKYNTGLVLGSVVFAVLALCSCIYTANIITGSLSTHEAVATAPASYPTRTIVRIGEAEKFLGFESVDFGSANQAAELLRLIEQEPNKADYRITYKTDDSTVIFGCNFDKDIVIRIRQDDNEHGSQEMWQGYIIERLNSAINGGSLNETPDGTIPGIQELF